MAKTKNSDEKSAESKPMGKSDDDAAAIEQQQQRYDETSDHEQEAEQAEAKEVEHAEAKEVSSISQQKKKKVHKLSLAKTEDFNAKLRKRGVVYLARIPPRMNPTKVKSLLSDFGVVTRVYLKEEDAARRKRRRKMTGSSSKRYVEGWVEFERKRIAKFVAQNLNNTPITNHKRNVHYGDLWNMKYLSGFKWAHLTEKVAYERRVREQKLRMDMMQARRENASYTHLVETGKKLDKIEERKRKRQEQGGKKDEVEHDDSDDKKKRKRRKAKQTKPLEEGADAAAKKALLSSLV